MNHAAKADLGRGLGLAEADREEAGFVLHLRVEGAHRLGQLAVDGVDGHRRQAAVNGEQQPGRPGVVVDDVELLRTEPLVDPRQVGRKPHRFPRASEVRSPGGVGDHLDTRS